MNKTDLIEGAISTLGNGGIIGFPTDTVYGIGCDAHNLIAIDKIYKIKHRNKAKPLILFIKDTSELDKYVYVPEIGLKLINAFWPGALTIIFKAKSDSPIKSFNDTMGIRIPVSEPIFSILSKYSNPLATTSANIESFAPSNSHLDLTIKVDFVIPGTSGNISSTIIDISFSPVILREGKISREEIESVIGKITNAKY
ncbi:MAG: L-threonylcarbamoyladenylate synthase [bacterium]|nr:L-threonylcarbamoyladenylate synthase [bacterium]